MNQTFKQDALQCEPTSLTLKRI